MTYGWADAFLVVSFFAVFGFGCYVALLGSVRRDRRRAQCEATLGDHRCDLFHGHASGAHKSWLPPKDDPRRNNVPVLPTSKAT